MKSISILFWTVLICAIIAIVIVFFVPRNVDLPPVDDISITIIPGLNGNDDVELQGDDKAAFYAVLSDSKYTMNLFVGNNPYYYSEELVTVLITGTNVPYHLNLVCLPRGESVYKRDPYAFAFSGSNVNYKLVDNQDLFDFLNTYSGGSTISAEENQQDYSYPGDTTIEIDDRSFILEDLPVNSAEETVAKYFIYTITGEFDKKPDILAHGSSVESERKNMEEGVYIKSYVIHDIASLSDEQYLDRSDRSLFENDLQKIIADNELTEYKIVSVDFTVMYSETMLSWGPQYPERKRNMCMLVGKKSLDDDYRIYEYGMYHDLEER